MVYFLTALFVVFDMITGIVKAFKNKKVDSSIMREGLFHKCGSVFCIVFGVLVDYAQTLIDLGITIPVATSICSYVILMEIGSIIENICFINPKIVPNKLQMYFNKLTKREE